MNKENWDGLTSLVSVVLKGAFWVIIAAAIYVSALHPIGN